MLPTLGASVYKPRHTPWGSWVRDQRKAAKMGKRDLAQACDVDPSLITLIERDGHVPRRPVALRIGEAFGSPELGLVMAGYVPVRFAQTLARLVRRSQ